MKNLLVILSIILANSFAVAQGPRVPNKMRVGDVQLKITDGARAEIQKNVDDLTKHPKYFNAKVDRANQYFHFIEDAFKKEGVPDDIKYLVLQESGLISDAVSTSNAVGYWQFKDFTAVEVGLRVDRHIDERKNIYASSIGAARYMKMNNGYFDNWIYAIQAYQMGAGGALKVTDKKLYGAKSMTINKKTYWYVKKYIAHKIAYESAVGKSRPSVYLSAYKSGADQSLNEVANKFKVSEEELTKYNKWLRKGKVPSDKEYTVIIPTKQLEKIEDEDPEELLAKSILVKKTVSYNQAQANLFPAIKPWKGSSKYSGSTKNINRLPGIIGSPDDRLVDLARKGNVSLGDFLLINNIEIDHRVIDGAAYYFKKKKRKAKVYYHVVREGETFWSISQKYGVQHKKILMKNRASTSHKLKEGRVLWMRHIRPESTAIAYETVEKSQPFKVEIDKFEKLVKDDVFEIDTLQLDEIISTTGATQEIDSAQYKTITHVVEQGNTYYNIANKYFVSVLDLVEWNDLTLNDKLAIGQELKVFVKKVENHPEVKNDPELDSQDFVHIVAEGDTLYSISRKYNISAVLLKEYNDKQEDDVAIGEKLKIPDKD